MALTMSAWNIKGNSLTSLEQYQLKDETLLENWIESDSSVLGMHLLFIGRQVWTTGGPLDLLAIDADGNLIIVELKRDKTPRDVVAQTLDYASCVKDFSATQISEIFAAYQKKKAERNSIESSRELTLAEAFLQCFGNSIPEWRCCMNGHGSDLRLFLMCEDQENQEAVSDPQLARV